MGNLTNDTTRLRGEVDALRSARGALMQDLAHGAMELTTSVSAMRADFAAAHAAMAERTRKELADYVSGMSGEVNALLADCRKARSEKASQDRGSLASFCAGLRKDVASMCQEMADDRAGARLAWCGRGAGMPRKRPLPKGTRIVAAPERVLTITPAEPRTARAKSAPGGKVTSKPAKKPAKRLAKSAPGGKVTSKPAKKPAKRLAKSAPGGKVTSKPAKKPAKRLKK